MNGQPGGIAGVAIIALFVVVMLGLRMRRMTRAQELSPGRLWLVPALFAVVVAATLVEFPPRDVDWLWLLLAFGGGGVLGWQRGRLMKIWRDPATGKLMSQGSGWAVVFLVVLILLRSGLRAGLAYEQQSAAIDAHLVNAIFAVFALGLFGAQRAEMALRVKRMVAPTPADGP